MDTFNRTTEPPEQRKKRTKRKSKWPKWLRTGLIIRLAFIWGPRIFKLGEAVIGFFLGQDV